MGTSFGGKAALRPGLQKPERVSALVLRSPAAIRLPGAGRPPARPETWHAGSSPIRGGSWLRRSIASFIGCE
jgi:pimeloyl-ACP methyl ester carboxylesterase